MIKSYAEWTGLVFSKNCVYFSKVMNDNIMDISVIYVD